MLKIFTKPKLLGRGKRIAIRKLLGRDFSHIMDWFDDIDLMGYAFGVLSDDKHILRMAKEYYHELMETPDNALAIVYPSSDEIIGLVRFSLRDSAVRYARIGIIIGHQSLLGKGLGTEALRLALDYFFLHKKINYVELDTAIFNERAQRCFLKCGFVAQGEFTEIDFVTGETNYKILMRLEKKDYLQANTKNR